MRLYRPTGRVNGTGIGGVALGCLTTLVAIAGAALVSGALIYAAVRIVRLAWGSP